VVRDLSRAREIRATETSAGGRQGDLGPIKQLEPQQLLAHPTVPPLRHRFDNRRQFSLRNMKLFHGLRGCHTQAHRRDPIPLGCRISNHLVNPIIF
jgi:hypothetical protein